MFSLKTKTGLSIILALFLVASLSGVVLADWPTDASTNAPVVTADYNQGSHRVIADGSGGFFAVWKDYREDSENTLADIYAQRFDADGNPLWAINGVPVCNDAYNQEAPKICLDGSGGCIISWEDQRSGDDEQRIYAQRLNESGIPQWIHNGIMVSQSPPDDEYQYCPWLVSDSQGGAIISWYIENDGIYLQRLSSSGSRLWINDIKLSDTGNYGMQKLIPDGQGGAIITWGHGTGNGIYIQRVDSSGNKLWGSSDVVVCNTTTGLSCPRIIPSGNGAIVIWDNSTIQILAQKINSDGALQWTDNGVTVFDNSYYGYSHGIASDEAGGAIITWAKDDGDSDYNVYARRIDSNGNLMWGGPTQITDTGDFNDSSDSPRKTVEDGAGGAITTWVTDDGKIYAQRVDGTGNALWTENGVLLCDAAMLAEKPSRGCPRLAACETACGATGALVFWGERRSEEGDMDIYMQGIGPDGMLGRPCPVCAPVGGEAYLVNKVGLAMPLLAIAIAIFAGADIIRRQHGSVR
jgi:hypothetical protein